MAQLDLTFFKRPCTHKYNRAESCSKGGQGWVKNYKGSSELVWGQRPKFSYSLPQAAFCEPLARGLTQLSTSSRACMKTLKQICKGLKSSTKTVHQFSLSTRRRSLSKPGTCALRRAPLRPAAYCQADAQQPRSSLPLDDPKQGGSTSCEAI